MLNSEVIAKLRAFSGVKVILRSSFCISWLIIFALKTFGSNLSSRYPSWQSSMSDQGKLFYCFTSLLFPFREEIPI